MHGFGAWRTWSRLTLVWLVASGTACGNSAGPREGSDTPMIGALGMNVTSMDGTVLWATYFRAFDDCPGTSVALGNCAVSRSCPSNPMPELFDAGEVSVAGTSLMHVGSYFGTLSGPVPYGQSIVAEAAGSDDVPAHSLSLTVPDPSIVIEPSSDSVVIDRTRDLVVRWQGGSGGTLSASVSTSSSSVYCRAAVSAGSITFPKALLAELEATDTDSPESLGVTQNTSTLTTKGEWELAFYASVELLRSVAVVE